MGVNIAGQLGPNCTNLIGKTTLDELIEELRKCQLLLTNDTGTMHLATLLGIPVVAIFGSTEPSLTGPLGRRIVSLGTGSNAARAFCASARSISVA